ncbi:MAG: hypothetical protein IPH31_13700 [Lewinellaceae bacterium]|nr:hypothetical protein [Lewinellaceae bacterium]
MKNKLVIWGTNAENEKVLIALELHAESNKVMMHTFPETIADEAFVQKMMHEWREGKEEVAFPEGGESTERELSVTDSLLPEHLKVDRPDLVQRAQTEWHFAVLSAKLHAAYQQELAEFKEKVEAMSAYDNKLFTSLRTFWDKVQNQSRERNLFRQHADELRDGINALFDQLKEVRKKVNSEFMEVSQGVYDGFAKALDEIDERITAGGAKFNSVFDELKKMQRDYHNTRMSNEHRNKLWDRLDAAFKKAKERKFGPEANAGTIADRHDKRLSGLEDAIKRLEDSLFRDDEELAFQRKKVNTSEGQLEAQIRGAKIKMIEERANGKRERLAELTKARNDVQRQASSAHEKEARLAAKEAERQQIEAKKAAIKSEIEAETHAKAAAAAGTAPEKEESLFEAASNLLGDVLLDALDTAKAVASVAADKAEEALSEVKEKAGEVYQEAKEKAGEAYSEAKEAYSEAKEKAGEMLSEAKEKGGAAYSEAKEKASEILSEAKEKATEAYAEVKEKAEEVYESFKKDDSAEATTITANDTPGDALSKKSTSKASEAKDYIIDDVVHKTAGDAEALESFKPEETPVSSEKQDYIIDDVVHKTAVADTDLESTQEQEPASKPKRAPKKDADA